MKQHPVPQHISSYEFKLVGDMTLKQFFQVAGGAVVALICYALPLPPYVKWPFILFFGAFGAALAFLPIEERPLSTWLFAFLKAIYAPTIFNYNPTTVEDIFSKSTTQVTTQDNIAPAQYLDKPAKSGLLENFETAEKNFFNRVTTLFQTGNNHYQQPVVASPQASSDDAITQGKILTAHMQEQTNTNATPKPTNGSSPTPQNKPAFKVEEEFDIPQIQSVKVGLPIQQNANLAQQQISTPSSAGGSTNTLQPVFSNIGNHLNTNTKQATFTPEAAPPSPPDRPNTIVGQVLTSDGKIIEAAILEIRDSSKKPVRAIRSNKVGHFMTVTPLQDGVYEIDTEKEGFVFEAVTFKAEGSIIQPIQIKAKQNG